MSQVNFAEAIAYLHTLEIRRGIRPGLERMRQLLYLLGDPQRHLRVVHVAGTNGKGSTARMIQAMLSAAGYRTGLFSSPGITGICDTVMVDGNPISKRAFSRLIQQIAETEHDATSFEVQTALALCYFAQQKTDVCVVECGMGGAQDATNIFDRTLCGVITPIAMDHTAFLGTTIQDIARQKAGILQNAAAAVTAYGQTEEVLAVLYETAAEYGLTVYMPALPQDTDEGFRYADRAYTLSVAGRMQVQNACTALQVIQFLGTQGFAVSEQACREGLASVRMPCRQERLQEDPLLLLDGAHNPHNMQALADTLQRQGGAYTVVIGMLADKDTEQCCRILAPYIGAAVCCDVPNPRTLPAEQLAKQLRRAGVEQVLVRPDPVDACRTARKLFAQTPTVVTGSLYLAGALREKLTAQTQKN